MLKQRGTLSDITFFRILKNKNSATSKICNKLDSSIKNISLLSRDELCELWMHIKDILLRARRLHKQTLNDKKKYMKECSLMVKLLGTITKLAQEAIKQKSFVPDILLQNIMLLHLAILPNLKDEQVKNQISYLLETWWKLNMTWKEKMITNALKYLIEKCKSSLQHVKRLHEVKSAILFLKSTNDIRDLVRLVREKTVMSLKEGRLLILHLFTLGEKYILGIHNNVRVVLQNKEHGHIAVYANLYITAWLNATEALKKFMIENCWQNIVFHCFRAYRDSAGRGTLGKNLLSFLSIMHDSKHQVAKLTIHNQCKPLLWPHLTAPGTYIRCNAVEILFVTSSVQYTCAAKDTNKIYLQKYYKTITNLLQDTDVEVCNITILSLFTMLKKHWNCVPSNVIREWLTIFQYHTENADDSRIRMNIFIGLRKLLNKERSRQILKNYLPNFAKSIYDNHIDVLQALFKLLYHAQDELGMSIWDIVPFAYVLHRLETTEDIFLLKELIKLVWIRISSHTSCEKMIGEMQYIGLNYLNAIRKLSFHSVCIINWDTSKELIEEMLCTIKKEMNRFPSKNTKKRIRQEETVSDKKKTEHDYENDDPDRYINVQICIDIIAMLLSANIKNMEEETFYETEASTLKVIGNTLPELLKHFNGTSINESVMFLSSLVPPRFIADDSEEIFEMLVRQLRNTNSSDDTILTIVSVFMNWDKCETILTVLTNLFTESLNINVPHETDVSNGEEILNINEQRLDLGLRILKHLLQVEYEPILLNKYRRDLLQFWETLHSVKAFIEKKTNNVCSTNCFISKAIIVQLFKEYMSMILFLHKKDVFEASEYLSDILLWIRRIIVPHVSHLDLEVIENHHTCIGYIKNALTISNTLAENYNCSPKMYCDIVLLYCSCLQSANGIVFVQSAFDAIIRLLDFSKISYEKQERSLLEVVVPNFICLAMTSLTRYNDKTLHKYTNNLEILSELTQRYFETVKNTFNNDSLRLQYVTIMFCTALSDINAEVTRALQCSHEKEVTLLSFKFPYLASKILKVLFSKKSYGKLCVQMLSNAVRSYDNKVDMLAALMIINRMLKTSNKVVVKCLRRVTLSMKKYNEKQSHDTPFNRSVAREMNKIVDKILNQ